jgi:hypothetical protein
MEVKLDSNVSKIKKRISDLAKTQLPFATARMLSDLAKQVTRAELTAFPKILDKPTPFTMKSIGTVSAKKSSLVAKVFMKDITAAYLMPYEFGGVHMLNKGNKYLFEPGQGQANQYGNLPRNKLASLKSRPDIFIGPVKTKDGVINGVWQRITDKSKVTMLTVKQSGRYGRLGKLNTSGHLKLLIRFADNKPVTQELHYMDRAKEVIKIGFYPAMNSALTQAIATAK